MISAADNCTAGVEPLPDLEPADRFDTGWVRALISGETHLTRAQALDLYHRLPLLELGRWADARCRAIHGPAIRTYVIDRNINYTNVCSAHCTFCAFRRDAEDHDSYTLSREEIHAKVRELRAIGGTQILMQGGMNPALPIEWYEDLLSGLKSEFPGLHLHAFSPPEFIEFVRFFNPPGESLESKLTWVIERLGAAGLDSIPGGGGEIFAEKVRRRIGLGKCTADEWLTVMFVAHRLGMDTSATMMFGHIEGIADRVDHFDRVRNWQDRAIREFGLNGGGRYKAFIAWPFQRENTPLGRLPDWDPTTKVDDEFPGDAVARGEAHPGFAHSVRRAGASDYLRTQALARLYLDNVYSIGASWVTMGPHIGQVALAFGANDMGSVMMEENVVSAAGTTYCLNEATLCRLIRSAGFIPAQRDNAYNLLRVHAGPESPDLAITDWSTQRARRLATARQESHANAEVVLTIGSAGVAVSATAADDCPD